MGSFSWRIIVNGENKDRLAQETLDVWQSRTSRQLSNEDAREIVENTVGFFRLLSEWANNSRSVPAELDASTPVTPVTEKGRGRAAEDAGQLLDRTLFRSRQRDATDSSP